MKVILLQDVARIGRRFDIKEVPSGHALNYLIPQKIAEPATAENIKRVEARKSKKADDEASAGVKFEEALGKLGSMKIELKVEANEKGHLFKGLKEQDIAGALEENGFTISPSQIVLSAPIKEVGEHTISLASGGVEGVFTLSVVAKQ
jgi:large subunit ribosomal protein L9